MTRDKGQQLVTINILINPEPLDADNNLLLHPPRLWRLKGHLETSEYVCGWNKQPPRDLHAMPWSQEVDSKSNYR